MVREPAEEPVARVRNLQVADAAETPIRPQQVLKGYEVQKDRYITFQPEEIKAIRPRTSTELTITEFVRLDVAFPLNRQPGGDAFELYIGIGQAF